MFFFRVVIYFFIQSNAYLYIAYQGMAGGQLKKSLPISSGYVIYFYCPFGSPPISGTLEIFLRFFAKPIDRVAGSMVTYITVRCN